MPETGASPSRNSSEGERFFAVALENYLRSHRQTEVTERLNEIYREEEESSLDPVMTAIQSASLPLDE